MWNALKNAWNRTWNTVGVIPRAGWTWLIASADSINTTLTLGEDLLKSTKNTANNLIDVLMWAWNHGKWYHKALNIPLSPLVAGWTLLEWAVRTVLQPTSRFIGNTKNTIWNMFKNIGSSIGTMFSKKPISDFSYEKLQTKELKPTNWISKWQAGRWKWKSKESESEWAPVSKKEKINKSTIEETKQIKENKESEMSDLKDLDKVKEFQTLSEIAAYLWVQENDKMKQHKQDIVQQMKEWKPIKDYLIKYEDEAREIVWKHKWDRFSKWNIAMDILKANIISDWMKSIKNDDPKYKKDMENYLKENLSTAKTHLRNIKLDNIIPILEKISGSKGSKLINLDSNPKNKAA